MEQPMQQRNMQKDAILNRLRQIDRLRPRIIVISKLAPHRPDRHVVDALGLQQAFCCLRAGHPGHAAHTGIALERTVHFG